MTHYLLPYAQALALSMIPRPGLVTAYGVGAVLGRSVRLIGYRGRPWTSSLGAISPVVVYADGRPCSVRADLDLFVLKASEELIEEAMLLGTMEEFRGVATHRAGDVIELSPGEVIVVHGAMCQQTGLTGEVGITVTYAADYQEEAQ